MSQHASGAGDVARSLVAAARSENLTFVAASLAYYAFVSLLPLLLLSLVAASTLGGPALAEQVTGYVETTLGPGAGDQVHDALVGGTGRGGATVVGFAFLLWSGLKVFRGLDVAFSQMYGERVQESLPKQLLDGVVVLATVGFGVVLIVAVGTFLESTGVSVQVMGLELVEIISALALVGGLTVTLLPLYYLFPDRDLTFQEALPGAVFTAGGWTLLQTGFRLYASAAGTYEAYGVIGGGLLLVTLLYFGGIILLLGAVLNAVLEGHIDAHRTLERGRGYPSMTDTDQTDTTSTGEARDEQSLEAELEALRSELEQRTVHRDEVERDLRRYVRQRLRRGHAQGWGPYLVLLYGTAMTLGAFYFLQGIWAVLAMFVIWTSTLGVYVLMLLVGAGLSLAGLPGRLRARLEEIR